VSTAGLLRRGGVAALNEVWFRKAPTEQHGAIQTISSFFHPLDGVRKWNRIYGRPGFLQYQYAVPVGQQDMVRDNLRRLSDAHCPAFLAILKRFGAQPGYLSFRCRAAPWPSTYRQRRPAWRRCSTASDELVVAAGARLPRQFPAAPRGAGRDVPPSRAVAGRPRPARPRAGAALRSVPPPGPARRPPPRGRAPSRGRPPRERVSVKDALGSVQSVVVLGGGSDIGRATVRRLVADRTGTVVLAAHSPERLNGVAAELWGAGASTVEVGRRTPTTPPARSKGVEEIFDRYATSTSQSWPSECSGTRPSPSAPPPRPSSTAHQLRGGGSGHPGRGQPDAHPGTRHRGRALLRRWRAGSGRQTSSTARPRPASTASARARGLTRRHRSAGARRPHLDDQPSGAAADGDHSRSGRRGDRRRRAWHRGHGLGAGKTASGDGGDAAPTRPVFRRLKAWAAAPG